MNLANSSEIQLGEETNWNCCVCWWRGGERGRRWVDRRGKEDRPPLHLSSTQLHPTPARLWWRLRPCQRVKQRLLARNLFSASATLRQPVSPRQPSGPQRGAGTWHLAPGTWHLASPLDPTWGWHGAEEPITRSPLNRLKANAELVRTAFFWKLLVEDLGQSGWLSNKKPISRNSCLSPPAQAFDNNFLFKSLITCVHL